MQQIIFEIMQKPIYAGSFDPLHNGHKNVIEKALKIVDELIIVVSQNPWQNNLKTLMNVWASQEKFTKTIQK